MPATRRSTGSSRAATGPSGKQSTLSFNHRITKASASKGSKNFATEKPTSQSPLSKQVTVSPSPEDTSRPPVEVRPGQEEEDEEVVAVQEQEEEEKSEAELRAAQVTDRQIEKYWKALEAARVAGRVHQRELDVSEKVLRYWDASSQYGPCVGITRMKRWKRADRLGLDPPVEVLAVLLRAQQRGASEGAQLRAHVDEILNSQAAGTG